MKRTKSSFDVGSPAPEFSLPDASGQSHAFGGSTGKRTVLIFYPGDMTPGCTMQLCAVRDDWKEFERAGIGVYGVNHAGSESHTRFSDAHKFPFPLLIDEGMKASKKYGAVKKIFLKTVIKRTVVGIGPDGRIVFYRHGMPKDADVLKAFT
jgi:thioredoxin-dependent peroxiredoxin